MASILNGRRFTTAVRNGQNGGRWLSIGEVPIRATHVSTSAGNKKDVNLTVCIHQGSLMSIYSKKGKKASCLQVALNGNFEEDRGRIGAEDGSRIHRLELTPTGL
jgi:hypothetical protein